VHGSAHMYYVDGITRLQFSRKLITDDNKCDYGISAGPYHVIYARGTFPYVNFHDGVIGFAVVTFIENNSNSVPEIKMVAASSGFFKFVVIIIFVVGDLLTFGWITMHSFKNKKMFKLLHVVKTSFPSSFVLPVDLKTSRFFLLVTTVVHFVITLPTVYIGGISIMFILTPVLGAAAAWLYSPLLGFAYIFMTFGSIIAHFSYLVSVTFSYCEYSTDNEILLCNSVSTTAALLFLFAIVVLLLFEFIAYSFVYRLLRYKLWLSEQSILQEPMEFEYQSMSANSKDI